MSIHNLNNITPELNAMLLLCIRKELVYLGVSGVKDGMLDWISWKHVLRQNVAFIRSSGNEYW